MRKREGGGRRGGGEGGGLSTNVQGHLPGVVGISCQTMKTLYKRWQIADKKMLQTALFVLCAMFTLCMVGGSQRMSASCGWCHRHIGAERINALVRASSIPYQYLPCPQGHYPLLSTRLAESVQVPGHG